MCQTHPKGKKVSIVYVIKAKIKKEDMKLAVKDSDTEIWHKRLGPIDKKLLETLARKDFLPSFVGISLKTCVYWLARKTQGIVFKSFSPCKKSQILDLIHTDVCMMQNRPIRDILYFVTFYWWLF